MDLAYWMILVVGLLAVVFTVMAIVVASRGSEKLKAMSATRTITAHEAAALARPGGGTTVELYGTAATAEPLISPVSGTRCIYYRIKISELQQSYSTYTDSRGFQQTQETHVWRTIKDENNWVPFMLRDSSGTILVLAKDAELIGEQTDSQVDEYHKQSEWVIPAGKRVYVLGDAVLAADGPTVQNGPGGPFIVSSMSEKELSRSLGTRSAVWWTAAIIALVAGAGGIAYSVANRTRPLQGDTVWACLILAGAVILAAIAYGAWSLVPRYKGVMMRGTPGGEDPWNVNPAPMNIPGGTVQSISPIPAPSHCPACGMPVAPGMAMCPGCAYDFRAARPANTSTGPAAAASFPHAQMGSVPPAPGEESPVPAIPSEPQGTMAVVQRDIVIGGAVAFSAGERVQVEAESPDPNRPDYKYVVFSKTLNKRFRLSDLDLFV